MQLCRQNDLSQEELWDIVPIGWPNAEMRGLETVEMKIAMLMIALLAGSSGFLKAEQRDKQTPIPQGITLCLQPMTGGFDGFLMAEMRKQQLPVVMIATVPNPVDSTKPEACDPQKSLYTMSGNVIPEGKSFSARSIIGLRVHLRDEVQASVKLVRNSDNAVVWAGDSDRGEVKKVAEHIVNQMLRQRPSWIPSPINR